MVGGGISPSHPECAYPDEKYVGDNEVYLIIGSGSVPDEVTLNRVATSGGG